jgi:transglutaminase-like putative cysteine protease
LGGLTGRTMQKDDAGAFLKAGGCLEAADIAARYVSGYLFAAPVDSRGLAPRGPKQPARPAAQGSGSSRGTWPVGGSDESVEVDTHAWLEALLPGAEGEGATWVGADPTNRKLAGDEHVKIGHGRFYGDVAPIRGVYRGAGGEAEHEVSVRMTRVTS